jgi:hypothetical protein
VRLFLRAIFATLLLLGGGAWDWTPGPIHTGAMAHESCCCGTPATPEDSCPCPKPDGHRGPQEGASERATKTALAPQVASRRQGPMAPRLEPSPAPLGLQARAAALPAGLPGAPVLDSGRDPDLGRHLACLSRFRI